MSDLLLKVTFQKIGRRYSVMLYFFLIAGALGTFFISLWVLQNACHVLGKNYVQDIIGATSNPFVALFIGLLATALAQSSSATVSVTLVFLSSGLLRLDDAVPIIMGANIGTTLTSNFFAVGYFGSKKQFRRAISAATLHDFFNVYTAVILFPLEYYFQIVSRPAQYLSRHVFVFSDAQREFLNFELDIGNKIFMWIGDFFHQHTFLPTISAFVMLLIAFKFFSLTLRNMIMRGTEFPVHNFIFGSELKSLFSGILLTGIVQSSSAVTSILIPWVVEKRVTLKKVFPFLMGVNLGTTLTALLVAFGQNHVAVSLALVHVFFNTMGILLFLPIKRLRYIPYWCAKRLGRLVWKNQLIGLLYILMIFFVIPYLLISLS